MAGDDRTVQTAQRPSRKAILSALRRLERANDKLCVLRSERTYEVMLDDPGTSEALETLDEARSRARKILDRGAVSPSLAGAAAAPTVDRLEHMIERLERAVWNSARSWSSTREGDNDIEEHCRDGRRLDLIDYVRKLIALPPKPTAYDRRQAVLDASPDLRFRIAVDRFGRAARNVEAHVQKHGAAPLPDELWAEKRIARRELMEFEPVARAANQASAG